MTWLLLSLSLALSPAKRKARLQRIEARLEALEQPKEQPATAPVAPAPPVDPDVQALRDEFEALKAEVATKEDLRKYQRKPNEKEMTFRFSGQLELRGAWFDLRNSRLDQVRDDLGQVPLDATSVPVLQAVGPIGDVIAANDRSFRPRAALRLYWEVNRFLDDKGDNFLFAYVMPELTFFLLEQDIDRYLLARNYQPDFARPRERLGFIIKKAAVGIQVGRFSLSAGVLQYTYGSGFFLNPTNRFTPKNPLDPRREVDGVPAVQMDVSMIQHEKVSLSLQLAYITREVRHDVMREFRRLSIEGLGLLKLSTPWFSLTGVGTYQTPNELGMHTPSFGGIASFTPFGLTLSCELMMTESPTERWKFLPELVASFQAFIPQIGPAGTTVIVEYYRNEHLPTTRAAALAQLTRAIEAGKPMLAVDRLTRTLNRRQYAILYIEPSITERLKFNISGVVGIERPDQPLLGFLARAGLDYELALLTFHAYGGYSYGASGSEFRDYLVEGFAEVAVSANF